MERPERIALVAVLNSSARSATLNPGAAAIAWTRPVEIDERSASTTTTFNPRTTALLKVHDKTANASNGITTISRYPARSRRKNLTSREATSHKLGLAGRLTAIA